VFTEIVVELGYPTIRIPALRVISGRVGKWVLPRGGASF
jgi:hypothetical protein